MAEGGRHTQPNTTPGLNFSSVSFQTRVFGGTLIDDLLSFRTLERKAMRVDGDEFWRQERRELERRAKYDLNARRELDGKKSLEYWFGLMVLGLLALWYGLVVMHGQPVCTAPLAARGEPAILPLVAAWRSCQAWSASSFRICRLIPPACWPRLGAGHDLRPRRVPRRPRR